MKKNSHNSIWIDLEMTGLDTFNDRIIEKALDDMDDWNTNQHNKSGLVKRIESSTYTYLDAQEMTIEFLSKYVEKNKSPMCGSGICQYRRFLARCMPDLENFFHYRNFDVSTIKEIVKRWYPEIKFRKEPQHIALQDIKDSIEELRFYRNTIFREII